jgi:hypothetical protein
MIAPIAPAPRGPATPISFRPAVESAEKSLSSAVQRLRMPGLNTPQALTIGIASALTDAKNAITMISPDKFGWFQDTAITLTKSGISKLETALVAPVDYRSSPVSILINSAARDFDDALTSLAYQTETSSVMPESQPRIVDITPTI